MAVVDAASVWCLVAEVIRWPIVAFERLIVS